MVKLHGWAALRGNHLADNEDEHKQIVSTLKQEIKKLGIAENLLGIHYCNGEAFLTATKFTNHFSGDIRGIIDLYKLIAKEAPGSYGLLYLHDDEDANGLSNAFQVYVLSKGTLKLHNDTFLSPYFTTVETLSGILEETE